MQHALLETHAGHEELQDRPTMSHIESSTFSNTFCLLSSQQDKRLCSLSSLGQKLVLQHRAGVQTHQDITGIWFPRRHDTNKTETHGGRKGKYHQGKHPVWLSTDSIQMWVKCYYECQVRIWTFCHGNSLIECLLEPRGSPAVAWVTDNLAYTHFSCSVLLSSSVVLSHTLSVQMTYVSVGPEAHKPPRSSLRDRSKGFPKERFLNMVLTRIYTHTHTHHQTSKRSRLHLCGHEAGTMLLLHWQGLTGLAAGGHTHHCGEARDVFDRVLHLLLRHLDQNAAVIVLRRKRLGAVPRHPRVHLDATHG